jgi:hypothetical protein
VGAERSRREKDLLESCVYTHIRPRWENTNTLAEGLDRSDLMRRTLTNRHTLLGDFSIFGKY